MNFNFNGKIKSFEILSSEKYVVYTTQGEIVTEQLRFQVGDAFTSPIIRRIDDETLLIADSICNEYEKNVKIYNKNGKVTHEFVGGDSISDIKVYDRKFVFSYNDHGIMEKKNISQEGLIVFDKMGKIQYGFNSIDKFTIWDCYHTIRTGTSKILFFGYGNIPILELDLTSYTLTEEKIPIDLYADSTSHYNGDIYWKKSDQISIWDRNQKTKRVVNLPKKKDNRFLVEDNLVSLSRDGYEFEKITLDNDFNILN